MDAPILRFSLILLSLFISTGANYQTPNFTVTAPTAEVAKRIGDAAEVYRRDLAEFWLNRRLPNWSRPCRLRVRPGSIGAGGETKFQFVGGEVLNWNMYVQGSLERILDSVLPHEINHTIFACHFRRPLPRWADEGAATLFEHRSEQVKQLGLLNQVLNSEREFISLRRLLTMKEYPKGYRPMLILYAEGYALADFLVQQGGRPRYLKFMADGERMGWTQAIKANYHHGGVDELQKNWRSWVMAGMPKIKEPNELLLAASKTDAPPVVSKSLGVPRPAILEEYLVNTTVRLQSPDTATKAIKPQTTDATGLIKTVAANIPRPAKTKVPPKVNQSSVSESLQDAVFFNVPSKNSGRTAKETLATSAPNDGEFRDAAFEAPLPQRVPRKRTTRPLPPVTSGSQQRTPARPRLESTGLSDQFSNPQISQRKHLPQERRAVTGSIPQWAGFPGQKELF